MCNFTGRCDRSGHDSKSCLYNALALSQEIYSRKKLYNYMQALMANQCLW